MLSCKRAARVCAVRGGVEKSASTEPGSAVEEKSGIGERMDRTTTKKNKKKTTGVVKRKAGKENSARAGEQADGLTNEDTQVVVQVVERALHGDSSSRDTFVGLSNQDSVGAEDEASPGGFSQALAWGAEPEWQGESSEAVAESAGGSREPENPDS